MRLSNHRASYDAPQSEIIDFQIESNFMNGTNYSRTFSFGESSVVDAEEELL